MYEPQTCPACKKTIDWQNEKAFILEYRDPFAKMNIKQKTIHFFHPTCWVSAAGMEWARQLGYDNL